MESRVRLVPAEAKHIGRIARLMREIDTVECTAMGKSPKQALRQALGTSHKAWTALVDDKPEAMFGVVTESLLGATAVPWFLGTDEVYRHGRELLMWGPAMIGRLCDSSTRLHNLVSARNSQAIRLLRRWGFTVTEEEIAVRGVPFRYFERASADV